MKKYIYIALAAAAFASCSQDEALELNQEAIDFDAPFVENATRAATDPSLGTANNPFTSSISFPLKINL